MAAGTRRGLSQDRIIVHAPLDVFGVAEYPGENLDRKPSQHASSASSRVAVRPGQDGAGGERNGRRVGYAMRHIRKQSEEKPRQKQSPGVLPQASVGVVRTTPVQPGSIGKPLTKPDFREQHESTEATSTGGRTRQVPLSADLKEQYPHPPPQWRPISSVTHTPPRRHRYSATPPERDREHGSNPQNDRHYIEGRVDVERNMQKNQLCDEGRLEVENPGDGQGILHKDQRYNEGRLDVGYDERDFRKDRRYDEGRLGDENDGHHEESFQTDQHYDEGRLGVERLEYQERNFRKNPRYDGGRLDAEKARHVPPRHPEAVDERRREDGWAVRQQGDAKHGDGDWAGQNGRYRSPNQQRYSPFTPRHGKGREYEHEHCGPETLSGRREGRYRYGENPSSRGGSGDGGGGGDGRGGGAARYHGGLYDGSNDSHGSRQDSFVRGRDRYGGGSDYGGSKQDVFARGRDRYGGGNDSRGSKQDSFASGRDRYRGDSDSRGSKQDSFVNGRDRYGGGEGSDYHHGSKQESFVTGQYRYGGGIDSRGSKQDSFVRGRDRYPSPERYKHDYRTAGDHSGRNQGGWKGRTTATPGGGSFSDRDVDVGMYRVGYIDGEGNEGGVGGGRTTLPEIATCRRGHAQTQPLPPRRRPSPGIPTKMQSQDDECTALRRPRRSPRRAKRAESIASPVPTGRHLWTSDDENRRPKPESLNEALVKSPSDMLLFSKKARRVDFKPRTLKEYRATRPTGYVELGKLQPDLHTDELVAKRANAERVKEFSVNLRQINSDTAAARRVTSSTNNQRTPANPAPAQDARSKAIAFARRIPRPRKISPARPPETKPPDSVETKARRRADRRGDRLAQERLRQGGATGGMEALDTLQKDVDGRRKGRKARGGL